MKAIKDPALSEEELGTRSAAALDRIFLRVAKAVKEKHDGAYLQPLFKNAQKCKELFSEAETYGQGHLFGDLNDDQR